MYELADHIVSYLAFLERTYELSISIHFSAKTLRFFPDKLFSKLEAYSAHTNPYCAFVKKDHWETCICAQQDILHDYGAEKSFCKTCHAGVTEYISRIYVDDEIVAYVAVSGYRSETPVSNCMNMEMWKNCLSCSGIPVALLDTVIPPLCSMFELLFRYPMPKENQDEYNLIIQYLRECHGQIDLEQLCKRFGRSKSYISHMFNEKCKISLPVYCNGLKLDYARILLSKLDIPITEVALEAGYNDVSYFIHRYKERFGTTPLQYRKLLNSQPAQRTKHSK